MKKNILALLVLGLSFSMAYSQKLVIKGSDTVLPLSQLEAEDFMKENPKVGISVVGGGSGVGIAALIDKDTDIAQSSRPIKGAEKKKARANGVDVVETSIAKDALTVIVNKKNKVSKLTFEQIEKIFTGQITNWKDVGGDNKQIVLYSRESSSGTYTFFREHVMSNKDYAPSTLLQASTGPIVAAVSQTEGAIGYIGFAYLDNTVKALSVSSDGKNFIEPDKANVDDGTYPITRDLLYYTNGKPKGVAKDFIDYILSPKGQNIVEESGYMKLIK